VSGQLLPKLGHYQLAQALLMDRVAGGSRKKATFFKNNFDIVA
jgi:hypothetical protein